MRKVTYSVCLVLLLVMIVAGTVAAKSNEIVIYAALTDKDILPLQEACKAATGLDLKAVVISIGQAATRIKAEDGYPQADVLIGGSIEFHEILAASDLLVPYMSPEAEVIDAKFKDPEGRWTGFYLGVLGLVINTELFEKELPGTPLPRTWEDLLDPAYKGKFVSSNPATAGAGGALIANQIFHYGNEEQAWDYIKKLDENVAQYQSSSAGPINLVATGEYPIGLCWVHDALMKAEQGYPLEVIIPENTAYEVGGISILKGARNPENAKIFVDWVLGQQEGTRFSESSYRYSARPDVPSPEGTPELESISLVNYDFAWASQEKERIAQQFADVIGR